jgi:hypothetical protein
MITTNPPVNTLPTPGAARLAQFAIRLKTNARWMKQFLHGSK